MAEVLALVDYGAGNLHSVANALKAAGAEGVTITADPDVVRAADRIVLPGVGSFKACAEGLRAIPNLVEAMAERVHVGGAPFLGICVGMQLLATRGVEHGVTPGLNWIEGEVRRIEAADPAIKIPHMGWNDVALPPHPAAGDLIERIRNPSFGGNTVREQAIHLHTRLARPLINIIAVFLTVPLVIRRESRSLIGSMALCAAVMSAIYVFAQALMYAAGANLIAADTSAWIPVILSGSLCAWLSPMTQT